MTKSDLQLGNRIGNDPSMAPAAERATAQTRRRLLRGLDPFGYKA